AIGLDDVSWATHAYACEGLRALPQRHRYGRGKSLPRLALASISQSAYRRAGRDIAGHLARGPGCERVSAASSTSRSGHSDASHRVKRPSSPLVTRHQIGRYAYAFKEEPLHPPQSILIL